MAQRHAFTKTLVIAMAGAMLLAACGNSGESRTRNAALEGQVEVNCWANNAQRNARLQSIGQQIQQAFADSSDLEALEDDYNYKAAAAKAVFDALSAAESKGNSSEVRVLRTSYEDYARQAGEALELWSNAQSRREQAQQLTELGRAESEKPLCADVSTTVAVETSIEETPQTSESPTTSTPSEGGELVAAGMGACEFPEAYVMKARLEVGESTTAGIRKCGDLEALLRFPREIAVEPSQTDEEFVWTLTAVSPGTHTIELFHVDPETEETSVKQPFTIEVTGATTETTVQSPSTTMQSSSTTSTTIANPVVRCDPPTVREGTSLVVRRGETFTFSVEPCAAASGVMASWTGDKGVELVEWTRVDGEFRGSFKFLTVGEAFVGFTNHLNLESISDDVWVEVRVIEPEAVDPCDGKMPDAAFDADLDGGTLTAASTCEEFVEVLTTVRGTDGRSDLKFYMQEGIPLTGFRDLFGAGQFEITLTHGRAEAFDGGTRIVTSGETRTIDVLIEEETTPDNDGTVSNGAVVVEARPQGVVEVPAVMFTPAVATAPENPKDTGSGVPVLALPAETTVLSCGNDCVDTLLDRAGVEQGTIEIAFGDSSWTVVAAGSSFVAPVEATSVKVRVTPDAGEKVEMAAVITRESVDDAYSEASGRDSNVVSTSGTLVDDVQSSGSSFPLWLVLLIAALVVGLGGVVARRRLTERNPS